LRGSIINDIRIEELGLEKLILLQKGIGGFDDPTALKYYFIPELTLQKSIQLTPDDIHSITGADTIYKGNPKIYANYKGESFYRYLISHIGGGHFMTGKSGHLAASFIVSKSGVADSLKILESFSPEYDKQYAKAFYKARKDWKPAILNGKPVSVQMFQEATYSTSAMMLPANDYSNKANDAFRLKEYDLALYYYDQALKTISYDKENLYNRGICKKMLGNLAGACEDWKKVKELGGKQADALLEKYCR
jgi:tetratricopeptide (TPR) repeat protein